METTVRSYRIIAVEGMDGAGKSTLVRSLHEVLGREQRVLLSRCARRMALLFREMVEREGDDSVLYQHVLPPSFRQAAYIFEASVQFGYLQDTYAEHDTVLFDRWHQTWDVYCEEVDEFQDEYAVLRRRLAQPDVLFHVRVDPAVAYDRLVARSDRWCRTYSPAELRAKLERLNERYQQSMAGVDVVPLDGNRPAGEVLKTALRVIDERGLRAS